jgi:hypothetical protein
VEDARAALLLYHMHKKEWEALLKRKSRRPGSKKPKKK